MRHALTLTLLALAGCKTTEPLPKLPEIVKVTVTEYVAVPAELAKPCTEYAAKEQSYGEAKRLALLRLESIEECNKRMARIRALKGSKP